MKLGRHIFLFIFYFSCSLGIVFLILYESYLRYQICILRQSKNKNVSKVLNHIDANCYGQILYSEEPGSFLILSFLISFLFFASCVYINCLYIFVYPFAYSNVFSFICSLLRRAMSIGVWCEGIFLLRPMVRNIPTTLQSVQY